MSDIISPALSTYQDEGLFQKYDQQQHARPYLNEQSCEVPLSLQLSEYYSVSEIIKFFEDHSEYTRITLQFPDRLVMDSAYVLKLLQSHFETLDSNKRQFWILADTSYSSCCVDEVAGEHVKADIIVHFGDACLNPIRNLPVVYSSGKPKLSADLQRQFVESFSNKDEKICLVSDSSHSYVLSELTKNLIGLGYTNVIYTDIPDDIVAENSHIVNHNPTHIYPKTSIKIGRNRVVHSKETLSLSTLQQDYSLFHITIPEDPQLLFLTTQFNKIVLYDTVDNETVTGPFPSMMKRYKFMHVARTAGTIGILVNTLSLNNTKETINALTKLIRKNDKKSYLFVVGKPNVAKLANFESIDIWCILGCPQGGIIVDQYNEFYKPVITPYELQLSLEYEVTWTGKWVTQFEDVLKKIQDDGEEDEEEGQKEKEDGDLMDEPIFSAVTGKYVSTSRPLRQVQHLEIEGPSDTSTSNSLVKNFSGHLTIRNTVSTSAAALQNRSWTGLGSDFRDDDSEEDPEEKDGATLQLGISGVARGYTYDRENAGA